MTKTARLFVVAGLLGVVALAQVSSKCSKDHMAQGAKASEFVAIATVKKVFSPPGYWSGMFAAMQLVEYEPVESLKGKLDQSSIVVSHYVVANSLTTDAKEPHLSPDLFRPGRKVVLFLNSGEGQSWKEASGCTLQSNEACALVANDDEHRKLAKAAKTDPQPAYTVKDENCGVIAADSDLARTVRTLLSEGQ